MLSYLSYSVVKEPTSAKGRLDCQTPYVRVKRNISCCEKKLRLTRKFFSGSFFQVEKNVVPRNRYNY